MHASGTYFERPDRNGEFWSPQKTLTFAEPLIDRLGRSNAPGSARRNAARDGPSSPAHWAHREPAPYRERTV
jgi:hypothetical protein